MSIREKYDVDENYIQKKIEVPNFKLLDGIILIVGSSGSGKSTILNSVRKKEVLIDRNINIIDNFNSEEEGEQYLNAFGLRTVPTWFRTIDNVSNGEQHRAEIAISMSQNVNVIDEFTSVIDRTTAKSLSVSVRKYYNNKEQLFIASCHHDIEEWLCPDYIYDTDLGVFLNKRYLRRPTITIDIKSSNYEDWKFFSKYHYLDSEMSVATHSYTAYIDNKKVAFLSVIHGTGGTIPTYWRESRLVVLPEWQGFGIGTRFSDIIASLYKGNNFRYFSKTAHPALGIHRENSKHWKPSSTNLKKEVTEVTENSLKLQQINRFNRNIKRVLRDVNRVCYSHEYIGNQEFTLADNSIIKTEEFSITKTISSLDNWF